MRLPYSRGGSCAGSACGWRGGGLAVADSPLISAVICTYNRADLLAGAIESLLEQTLNPAHREIIVVDNASTDGTRAVVEQFAPDGVRYVLETRQGLGYARNRGWQEARGEFVAYIDDDARAHPALLERALGLLQTADPDPLCVGGAILPFYTQPEPDWFKDEYEIRTWGAEARALTPGETFSGPNMVWRRDVLARYGGFPVDRGVTGDYLAVGEETGLFDRIWQAEPAPCFFYSPDLVVYHWVAPVKLSVGYRLKRSFITGQDEALHRAHSEPRLRFWARHLYHLAAGVLRALPARFRHRYWQNWVYEDWQDPAVSAGALLAALGVRMRVRQRQ